MLGIQRSMQTRLMLIIGGGLGGLLIAAMIAMGQLNHHLNEYERILTTDIQHERSISDITVQFKIQVQEWKNVLLRGKDPQQYDKYWGQFEDEQEDIQARGSALLADLPDGDSADLLRAFLAAHKAAHAQYKDGGSSLYCKWV